MRRTLSLALICLSLAGCADSYEPDAPRPQYTVRSDNVGTISTITAVAIVLVGLVAL